MTDAAAAQSARTSMVGIEDSRKEVELRAPALAQDPNPKHGVARSSAVTVSRLGQSNGALIRAPQNVRVAASSLYHCVQVRGRGSACSSNPGGKGIWAFAAACGPGTPKSE